MDNKKLNLEQYLINYVLKPHVNKFLHIDIFNSKNINLLLDILKSNHYDIFQHFKHYNTLKVEFTGINQAFDELKKGGVYEI